MSGIICHVWSHPFPSRLLHRLCVVIQSSGGGHSCLLSCYGGLQASSEVMLTLGMLFHPWEMPQRQQHCFSSVCKVHYKKIPNTDKAREKHSIVEPCGQSGFISTTLLLFIMVRQEILSRVFLILTYFNMNF